MDNVEKSYWVKRGDNEFAQISTLFSGVRILKVDGFTNKGKPVNIYTAQWVDSQTEDYMVTKQVTEQVTENNVNSEVTYDVVIRKNVDLSITFMVSDKYGATDVRTMHDSFISYMTDGELYIKSEYSERTMRCVCLEDYKPTTEKLKRASGSNYIIGTIKMHTLDTRAGSDDGYSPNPYPTPSGGGGGGGGTDPINAQFVKDYNLNKTQDVLNREFSQIPRVSVQMVGKTLKLTIN